MENRQAAFGCDVKGNARAFPHFWEHTVGSCHATTGLRADWQALLKRCNKDLGFKHVRFHGLLCDDMGTLVDENDKPVYSFFNADQIIDFLLSIGMRPFVELSFMPTMLSSGDDIVFHYKGNVTPPKNYDDWGTLISKLVQHWSDRYGSDEVAQWFFEVWNEPNLDAFWKGSQADYFNLYSHTVKAVKSVNNSFKCGGPATAMNAWIKDFVAFCEQQNIAADFISTHHYPTDAFGKPGDDTMTQLADSRRSVLREQAEKVQHQAGGRPIYYTEWSSSSNPFDEMHDMPYAAAFVVKTVMEATGLVNGYSYWTFSDIFEENYFSSVPFHGGFGLMNMHGIPKPAYRAFELLHLLGDELLHVDGAHDTVDAWVVRKERELKIIMTNWALPRHDIKTEQVTIRLINVKAEGSAVVAYIDDDRANAPRVWKEMGVPDYLSKEQVQKLEAASVLTAEKAIVRTESDTVIIDLTIKPQSVACITLNTV